MPSILYIETATTVCSVAVARDGEVLSLKESSDKNTHSSVLTLFIEEALRESGIEKSGLDAVAISSGPGSYTGLRIGVATAKGICYALDKPLIAVSTLEAMAWGMNEILQTLPHLFNPTRNPNPESRNRLLFCPMLDARRMEVYSSLYDASGNQVRDTQAEIINETSFSEYFPSSTLLFAGDGMEKSRKFLEKNPNALFLEGFLPSAKFMTGIAEKKFEAKAFEDIAYFEPFYLKDFIAGKPRVKGLR